MKKRFVKFSYTSSISFANTVQLSASCNPCLAVCNSVFILSIFSSVAMEEAVSFSTYFFGRVFIIIYKIQMV